MKRFMALILLLSMVLVTMPAKANFEYLGNMEVVNCKEWVSLRQTPSTSAKRLAKVSLGDIVNNCQQFGKEWIYAEYGGYEGYILAKYLQPCEGVSVYSAMLITNCEEGTDLYSTMGSLIPSDFIPVNTIVRDCAVEGNGRAYVQYGDRSGYVSAEHVEEYGDLSHYPQKVTLLCNLFDDEYEGSSPELKIDYSEGFYLMEYAYSEYEQEDAGIPRAEFVLHSDTTVNNVHLFNVSLRSLDDETGEAIFDATLEHIQYQVDPEHPLAVTAVIYGMMPNLAVGYQDWTGAYHFAFVEISGEDGSLLLREF